MTLSVLILKLPETVAVMFVLRWAAKMGVDWLELTVPDSEMNDIDRMPACIMDCEASMPMTAA